MSLNPIENFFESVETAAVAAVKKDMGAAYALLPAFETFLGSALPVLAKINWSGIASTAAPSVEAALGVTPAEVATAEAAINALLTEYTAITGKQA